MGWNKKWKKARDKLKDNPIHDIAEKGSPSNMLIKEYENRNNESDKSRRIAEGNAAGATGVAALYAAGANGQTDIKDPGSLGYNAEGVLNNIANENIKYYGEVFRPNNRAIIAGIGQKTNENNARAELTPEKQARLLSRSTGMEERNSKRYGIERTAADIEQSSNSSDIGLSKYRMASLSGARETDYNRDQQLSDQMINVGRGLEAVANKNLTTAATSESEVDSANSNIEAQNSAAKKQIFGTTVAALIAAFI